jgi:hypothetical protein
METPHPSAYVPTATDKGRHALRVAVATQLLCAAYLQFIEWVPVFPWNDLSHGNAQEVLDVVLAIAQIAFAACFARGWRWPMATGLAGYTAWLILQVDSWWRPYLLGGRTVGPRWYFARTYKFLPQIDHRPTPDAAHVLLQILLLLVIIAGVRAWRATGAAKRPTVGNADVPR